MLALKGKGMPHPSEEFFIRKIEEGLAADLKSLDPNEQALLRKPVSELAADPTFSPERARDLNAKCIGALAQAYARDTAGNNRQAALEWRNNNESIYDHSQLTVSGIVQNWYINVGRAQEKRVFGPTLLVWLLGAVAALVALWLIIALIAR